MKLPRRRFLQLAAGAVALPTVSRVARAQPYPTRPIRWMVGFAPGGATDILARLMGQWLSERLGQSVVIENRPGAGSNIATEAVVNAPADGYTLLLISTAQTVNATLYEKLNYNFLRDIAPVASLTREPNVMVVNPSVPAKTVPEFIAYAKTMSGKLNMASSGIGTSVHVGGELFKMLTGVSMQHVPRRGARDHRSPERADASHVRHRAVLDRIRQDRQAARARRDHRRAHASGAGHADHRRIRAGL
jgi:tripartite-type tricarboxylate transporter receptor subunit TctC